MDTIGDFIALNVAIIAVITVIGWCVGAWMSDRHDSVKGTVAFLAFWWSLGISFWVWVIYVIVHFVAKFW